MFTGLVTDVGTIDRVATTATGGGRDLSVRCAYQDLSVGESVAVSGVCLTVTAAGAGAFSCAAVAATLAATAIGEWQAGRRVNLERALRPMDRLGGHFVQGHVDGVGRVHLVETDGDALLLDIVLPDGLGDLMVDRGSIAIDGVSLTIRQYKSGPVTPRRSFRLNKDADIVQVSIIPHTRDHTTLGDLREGDPVHIEADMLAKHAQKLLAPYQDA
jgi:riboflavin synthase